MLRHDLPVVIRSALVLLAVLTPWAGSSSAIGLDGIQASKPVSPPSTGLEVERTVADLNASIPVLMKAARIPGLQVALIREGRVAWERGFGLVNSTSPQAVTSETIFEAASLTKPLFAYAVMQMVDRELIDLDRPLLDTLPKEQVEEHFGHSLDAAGFRLDWAREITPRQVLSHSAGMPHGEGGEVYPLLFEPGTKWKYSAQGYQLLQREVERVEGRPLEQVIDSYVLEPLGMEHSSMVWRDSYETVMANGHSLFGDPSDLRKRSRATAAASLYTTAGDYARFVTAVLAGAGLKPETANEMLASVVDMNDDGSLGWSLGFGLQRDGDRTAFWQWGDYDIFRNYVIADPERRSGIVYLTNSFNGLAVCSELATMGIGQEALGCLDLGYLQHDSPAYALMWDLEEKGAQAATAQLPGLIEKHPDVFTRERVNGLGEIMESEGRYAEAAAIFRANAQQHPRSGSALFSLGRASVLTGNLDEARKQFESSLSAPEDPAEQAMVDWALDYVKALQDPAPLDEAEVRAIAGDYGPRHLSVKDGALYYAREDAGTAEPRPLRAVSKDTFVIEGVADFKLQVVFDQQGSPSKLLGLYANGRRDESPRDR